jgi:NAD-dependent DNA ligase
MTMIKAIEWTLKPSGCATPTLLISPTMLDSRRAINRVPGYNASFLVKNGLGIGADIVVSRNTSRRPRVIHVNFPKYPDIPQFCLCGHLLQKRNSHVGCENTLCSHRGKGKWTTDQPIFWFTVYTNSSQEWMYPNYEWGKPHPILI